MAMPPSRRLSRRIPRLSAERTNAAVDSREVDLANVRFELPDFDAPPLDAHISMYDKLRYLEQRTPHATVVIVNLINHLYASAKRYGL
jgi:hypothetical protein